MKSARSIKQYVQAAALCMPVLAMIISAVPVHAAVANPAPSAKISFTFDDSLASAVTAAAPTLAKYGLTGTEFVITGCVGMTTAPNTCAANTDAKYMNWAQITQLQSKYGWEIGSHTVSHPELATSGLTKAQIDSQLVDSKAALAAHGFNAVDFATPTGDYNNQVLAEIAKVYSGHRGFWDVDPNLWPYNDLLTNNMQVQGGKTVTSCATKTGCVTVAQVEARIDQAITNKQWLVLTMHDIMTKPSTKPGDYQYSTAELDQIAAYVKSKQDAGLIKSVNLHDGYVNSDTNLLSNGDFASGMTGWSTDSAGNIVADTANNGSFPESTNAVSITAGATAEHLESPMVAVDSTQSYMLKSFLNMDARTSGELGYYVDEYDANGNWISGRWIKSYTTPFVQDVNFQYTPTSSNVKKASLQVYVTANSGIHAYVDQFQWFALNDAVVTPPPVTPTNLLTNGTFDAGISAGWTTDSAATIQADAGNHGSPSNPVNSVVATATTANKHLFSPQVAVSNAHTYSLAMWTNVTQLTSGEVGYYIDEYDSAGNWISGQYKTGVRAVSTGDTSFGYTPSSATVAKASLQVIVTGNSGIQAYIDDARWSQN